VKAPWQVSATKAAGVYPIVLVSYVLACTTFETQEEADLVSGFLTYVVSQEGQEAAASNAGSAPISDALREEATTAIAAITVAS
jgi:phosphate transport system substrate-binding protein